LALEAALKLHARVLPAWIEDERRLLRYLVTTHDGHPYVEDLLDAVCLITSWVLIAVAVLAVVGVIADALV
jgi:hypothetical protein